MEVVVLRPDGFALPPQIMLAAEAAAAAAGGSLTETSDRTAALAGASVLYAKEWGTTTYYGDTEADSRLRADLSDWCVRERWFAGALPDAKLMHCLPVRRNVAVADEVLDGGADGSSAPHADLMTRRCRSVANDEESTRSIHRRAGAQERGALHPDVQEQGIHHQGRRRGIQR
jgi:hypothetical protein